MNLKQLFCIHDYEIIRQFDMEPRFSNSEWYNIFYKGKELMHELYKPNAQAFVNTHTDKVCLKCEKLDLGMCRYLERLSEAEKKKSEAEKKRKALLYLREKKAAPIKERALKLAKMADKARDINVTRSPE